MANKKGGETSTFFAPNLTMNLTYLCYGATNIEYDLYQSFRKPYILLKVHKFWDDFIGMIMVLEIAVD